MGRATKVERFTGFLEDSDNLDWVCYSDYEREAEKSRRLNDQVSNLAHDLSEAESALAQYRARLGDDLLPARLRSVADRIAMQPVQIEDANTVREAANHLAALQAIPTPEQPTQPVSEEQARGITPARDVRIQSSTVTETRTPWIDLDEEREGLRIELANLAKWLSNEISDLRALSAEARKEPVAIGAREQANAYQAVLERLAAIDLSLLALQAIPIPGEGEGNGE